MKQALFAFLLACALATAAGAQPGPVKIGVLNDQSTSFADFGGRGVVEAVRFAVEDYGGKALGQPVQVVTADHQNKADIGLEIARKWYDNEGVDVIMDIANSSIALGVNGLIKERKKLAIFTSPLTDRMTEEDCTGYGLHWSHDAYSLVRTSVLAQRAKGEDSWFILGPDYVSGIILETTIKEAVEATGGKVIGAVRAPLGSTEYSSYLLQAQASKAKVIAVVLNGPDMINAIKQIQEFQLTKQGQKASVVILFEVEIKAIGQEVLQGIEVGAPWYWDTDDGSRRFAKRIIEKTGKVPSFIMAAAYSGALNYLRAVEAVGSKDADKVVAQLQKMEIKDFYARGAKLYPNGRLIHDTYLLKVKSPQESKGEWDYFSVQASIPAEKAYRPLSETKCPLVKK